MGSANAAEALQWLERELASSGIAFELAPHAEVSGFALVARSGPKRVVFTWEARAEILSVSYAEAEDRALVHDANISVPGGEGLYAEIASEAIGLLAA